MMTFAGVCLRHPIKCNK